MICLAAPSPRVELTTPADPGAEILALGLLKFEWLKRFVAAAMNVNLNRSLIGLVLPKVRL
jgi:hypothetical protein